MSRRKIDGFSAALIVTAPSLRAAAAAIPGIGRARAADLRGPEWDFIKEALRSFFLEEEAQRSAVTGRIKRTAPAPEKVAVDLAREAWRLSGIDPVRWSISAESRHVVSGSYKYPAEAAVVRGTLNWAPGYEPQGELKYLRESTRSTSYGAGWEYRIFTLGDKTLAERIGGRSWGGKITLKG